MGLAAVLSTLKPRKTNRVKTPLVLQMENVECGAAALTTIMGYYKKFVPLEEVRSVCGVSRNGVKASNIIDAAREFGFEADGYSLELDELDDMELPFIVYWNFNHFLTVEGYTKDKFYLNDPDSGHRTVSREEFDKAFTGVALDIRPGEKFQASGRNPNLFAAVLSRLTGAYSAVTFLVFVGLAMVIPGLLVPMFTKIFVDNILVAKLTSWIGPLLIGMAITAIVRGLLEALRVNCMMRLETKIAVSTASRFFLHILHLPIPFFQQRSAGDLANRITLNDQIASLVSRQVADTIISVFMLVFYFLFMAYYSLTLTAITIVIALSNIAIMHFASQIRKGNSSAFVTVAGKFQGVAMNGLAVIESLKASGREGDFFSKWAGHQAKYINTSRKVAKNEMAIGVVTSLTNALGNILVLSAGALLIMNGHMTIGMLVAFQSLMSSFLAPINSIVNTAGAIHELHGNITKLDDIQAYPQDTVFDALPLSKQTDQNPARQLTGHLELNNISFGYSPLDPPLIENFNLTVKPGQRIAIVGPSGCGKSTIIKLIMQLYKPWSGTILADGRPIETYPREVVLGSMSMVSQDINFFSGTIRENLTLWDNNVPEFDVKQAAIDASIHSDICSREGDYGSKIDEGGKNFSGGQRQRFEIARALVNNPRILLMDEATSALDPLTEVIIDESVRRRGCSVVIVAHRLSTIRDSDEIIVMDQGKIAERGTHESLLAQQGIYHRLVKTM